MRAITSLLGGSPPCFFTDGPGIPIPVSKQVKYLEDQTDNVFSKMNFKVCYWHSSPSLRRVTAATGPSFLAAVTTTGRSDYRIGDIYLLVDPNLFFLPPARRGLKGGP